jgi:predicted ATP-dependent endonuclease of OLD family
LVGRGDVGKSTILDAISYVLSPSWNIPFFDSDFHKGNTETPIVIEASLIDFPPKLLTEFKYGRYIRGLDKETGKISDEIKDNHEKVLTIRLDVAKDLEPKWSVVNDRLEPIPISTADRASINVYMVSDYVDRHFSWSKGNPLYSLLLLDEASKDLEDENIVIEVLRKAKALIDASPFEKLKTVTDQVKTQASNFGISIDNAKTSLDFKDISMKEGRVCLHDDKVPFRLKGKGSKRLISIAIQTALAQRGGITLIDEIEQGLEPDRVRQLVRTLKKAGHGQIFITTHSNEVITELGASELGVVINTDGSLVANFPDTDLQDVIRGCPEAFFSKKVIVCEGKTEVGICRALDKDRKEKSKECMSFKGCVYVNGQGGTNFTNYASKLHSLGFKVAILCDSDVDATLTPSKTDLRNLGIKVFDCEEGKSIEAQAFGDLPWPAVKELIKYREENDEQSEDVIKASVQSKYNGSLPIAWLDTDVIEIRAALALVSKTNNWFKRIDHGEFLGGVIFKYHDHILDKGILKTVTDLSGWIDE